MSSQSAPVLPFSFDLSTLVPRSVASLYSNLVTRPTGRALRIGIESQIGELGTCCLSILDFTQVVVLDYSCADEAVAKLIQRYAVNEGSRRVYFLARGLGEQHRQPIEAVLERHGLVLVAEVEAAGFTLLGHATPFERSAWAALQLLQQGSAGDVAATLGTHRSPVHDALHSLAGRRAVVRQDGDSFLALSALIGERGAVVHRRA
jgi:hypothetical protein